MALDIELLRQSFQRALDENPRLTERFYAILFERHPEVEPLFSSSARRHQPAKLAAALSGVVAHLDDAAWLDRTLGEMGRRHVGYGVTRAMYTPVGEALLMTLREAVGDDWTADHETHWTTAYGVVVDLMCPTPRASERAPVSVALG